MSVDFDARTITLDLCGRWNGRYGVARCVAPSHVGGDAHPSMHIADGRNGRPVFICRSQNCPDIVEGLKQQGLWSTSTTPSSSRAPRGRRRPTLAERIAQEPSPPPLPECCLVRPPSCSHWQLFNRQYLIAVLQGNLKGAAQEIIDLFATARELLSVEELIEELRFAVGLGAIAPPELPASILERAIEDLARAYQERSHAA